ncbi:hypothetical protein [Streptomyces sp. Root1310]|uniref:hypothetical protein n=1 Tax=Streptomyces sp. Root1310 TaxID=1736452 RepID=UPI0018FF0B3F|nr:hypothetical protein [Streptomyces sp. Root1310]
MNAIFTTPQRPFDITALFPQLAPLARTAPPAASAAGGADRDGEFTLIDSIGGYDLQLHVCLASSRSPSPSPSRISA